MEPKYLFGIDPGTRCGWAVHDGERVVTSGVWDLKPQRHEGAGMRYVRLRGYLNILVGAFKPRLIVYEEVRRHAGTSAAHIYGGITGALQEYGEDVGIPYTALPVGSIKKRATGKGNASKQMMVDSARSELGRDPADDNEADAMWIAQFGAEMYPVKVLGVEP